MYVWSCKILYNSIQGQQKTCCKQLAMAAKVRRGEEAAMAHEVAKNKLSEVWSEESTDN